MTVWLILPVILVSVSSLGALVTAGTCAWNFSTITTIVLTSFFVTYALPLTTMVFCYSRIIYALKRQVPYNYDYNYRSWCRPTTQMFRRVVLLAHS